MADEIAFTYDEKKNPEGAWLDGVPLRDLTKAEFDALPKHYRAAVKATPFYVPVKASSQKASSQKASSKNTAKAED